MFSSIPRNIRYDGKRKLLSPGILSENALFPKLFVIGKILSSEYQLYACGETVQIPQFEKNLLFSDKLLDTSPICKNVFFHNHKILSLTLAPPLCKFLKIFYPFYSPLEKNNEPRSFSKTIFL